MQEKKLLLRKKNRLVGEGFIPSRMVGKGFTPSLKIENGQ
jgi:hypothetical protein